MRTASLGSALDLSMFESELSTLTVAGLKRVSVWTSEEGMMPTAPQFRKFTVLQETCINKA